VTGHHDLWSAPPSFRGALVFAAVAGLAAVSGGLIAMPWPGLGIFRALFWCGSAIAAVAFLSTPPARARLGALAATPLAAVLLWLEPEAAGGPLGAAAVLGAGRLLACRDPRGRDVAVELVFAVAGVALSRLAGGSGPLGLGSAVWAFYLAQTPRVLLASRPARTAGRGDGDPFEVAERRAREWLGG